MPPALEAGSAFVPWSGGDLDDCRCETDERVVGKDHGVACEGMALQIPQDRHRRHDVKVTVRVHRSPDGRLARCHGPRCLVHFDAQGRLIPPKIQAAAEVRGAPRGGKALRAIALRAFPPRQSERTVYVLLNRTVLFVANS